MQHYLYDLCKEKGAIIYDNSQKMPVISNSLLKDVNSYKNKKKVNNFSTSELISAILSNYSTFQISNSDIILEAFGRNLSYEEAISITSLRGYCNFQARNSRASPSTSDLKFKDLINKCQTQICDSILTVYSILFGEDRIPETVTVLPQFIFPIACYFGFIPICEKILKLTHYDLNDIENNPYLESPASIAIKRQDISLFTSLVNHGLDINRYVMIPNSDLIINEIISTNNITFLNYILSLKPILSKFTKVSPLEHAFSCSFGFNLILNSIPNIKEEQQSYPKIIQTFISLNRKTNELLDKIFNQSGNCNYKPKTKLPLPGPHSAPRTNDKIKSFFNLPKNRFNEDALHLFNPHATIII